MLTERPISDFQGRRHPHILEPTCAYYEGSISDQEFRTIVSRLALCDDLFGPDRACILFGYGSQPRRTYVEMRKTPGVRVVWEGPCMPLLAYPLSYLAAAQAGLVVVENGPAVQTALPMLAQCAMVELYSFSAPLLTRICTHVKRRRWRSKVGSIIGGDLSYYCFGLDGGWDEYPAWYSYGPECPPRLRTLLAAEDSASEKHED
jgi:hypothetical protein